jgi:hypothetical protein
VHGRLCSRCAALTVPALARRKRREALLAQQLEIVMDRLIAWFCALMVDAVLIGTFVGVAALRVAGQ